MRGESEKMNEKSIAKASDKSSTRVPKRKKSRSRMRVKRQKQTRAKREYEKVEKSRSRTNGNNSAEVMRGVIQIKLKHLPGDGTGASCK
jgi:hypothetical protein